MTRVFRLAAALATVAAPVGAEEAWTFRVAPYLWGAGLSGEVGAIPGAPAADIDLSFGDILETLDFCAFLAAEARKGDWFLRADAQAVLTEDDVATPGPQFSGGALEAAI